MVIEKVLNNNVVIIKNEQGIEQVVSGKGIAFKKKPGDTIEEKLINQVFVLNKSSQNKQFQEIVSQIPLEYIDLAGDIIKMIKTFLGRNIDDSIYVSLSDHIYTAVTRFKQGMPIRTSMLWEIKNYYADEFELGLRALDIIKNKTGFSLNEDEAGFIALHIVNAESDDSRMEQTMRVTEIITQVINIVRRYFQIEFDTDSVYYYRFITHLKFFASRVVHGNSEFKLDDDQLLEIVKERYHTSYKCCEKIADFMKKQYDYEILDDEKLYLIIHIQRIVYKTGDKTAKSDL